MSAWHWLRSGKPRPGDSFGRPTRKADKAAQRWTDNEHCPAGYQHRGRCRHH